MNNYQGIVKKLYDDITKKEKNDSEHLSPQ